MCPVFRSVFTILSLFLLWSCDAPQQENTRKDAAFSASSFHETSIEYARQFRIEYANGYKLVEVLQPYPGAEAGFRYLLLPHNAEKPDGVEADALVRIPVRTMASLSTTHIPALDMLGASEVLTGFPSTDFISSPTMRKRVEQGQIRDLGSSSSMINIEALMELSPELVMAYSMGAKDKNLRSLARTGIPVVLNADYMEQNPLGRAEWIKFTAAFLNKEKEAEAVFSSIKNRYDSLAALTTGIRERPTVFSGVVYNGTWFMPGGKNWSAQFFSDAGADYLWSDNHESGSLQLSFESVFDKAYKADFWIGTANYSSLQALAEVDHRYTGFQAWQNKQVYTYTAKLGQTGGNDYLELGYSRPDMVLADLIRILHPQLLPGYDMYFYERLETE